MAEHSVKKEQLINWKILKQSEGQLLATNAYALLTSDYFSFSKTQCAVFKGTDRAVFLDKREFTGPIYTQIEEAVDFVLRNIRLGATIDGLVRKEKYELPPEAIREMIINAHCHRNLLDESCIQVAVYDERLEVTSPGGLYNGLTYEEVMNGHSKIRNKGIANIFSQMGLVEAWGSGIKRILNAAEEYGLPKPRFQEFDNMFRVELFRVNPITDQANQATNQANQDLERLDQVEDENVLSEKEIEILNLVRMQPSITQKEMANAFISKVIDGDINPIDAVVQMKSISETINTFLKDENIKDAVIQECEKYGKGESPGYLGAVIQIKETGVTYDFSVCNDPVYERLVEERKIIDEQCKEREKYLKTLSKSKTEIDEDTGDIFQLFPPAKQSTTSYSITFKK